MATQVSLNSGAIASAGALAIQTNGTTQAVSISTGQVATLAQNPILTSGTENGVAFLNGSKVLTTGSALVFDGTNFGLGGTNNSYGSQTAMTLSGTNVSRIDFRSNSTFTGTILSYQAVTEGLRLQTEAGYPITFYPAGTKAATIDTAGNLGLGVTPSGNAGQKTLSIANQTGSFAALTMGSNFTQAGYIGYNMGNTSTSNTWKYISADTGSALYFAGNEFRFMQFASGSAGATTSGTQAMTLDASGQLAIGTTTANPSTTLTLNRTGFNQFYMQVGGTNKLSLYADASISAVDSQANSLVFYTNSAERARIDTSGNLLVGTTSTVAGAAFVVSKSVNDYLARFINSNATAYGVVVNYSVASPNSTGQEFLRCVDSTADRMTVRSNGGIANYSGNNVNLSDRREKTNFAPAGDYLAKICAIPVQTFNYIDQNMEEDGGLTLGVVAQDVQAVAPELVMESDWGSKEEPKQRLSVYQTDLQYALMKCIQEQQALIQTLTARITALESA